MTLEPLPPQSPRSVPGDKKEEEEEEEKRTKDERDGMEEEEEEDKVDEESEIEVVIPLSLEKATYELAQSREQTETLLQRIELLSGRIRCGLNLVEETGSTLPTLPDPITGSDDVMVTSSHGKEEAGGGKLVGGARVDELVETVIEGDVVSEGGDGGGGKAVDPKLTKALEKMRRLDRRLADLLTREREVKDQRQRQFELHVTGIIDPQSSSSTGETGEVSSSSSSSSSATPSSSSSSATPSTLLPPVFPTQVLEETVYQCGSSRGKGQNTTDFIKKNIEEAGPPLIMSESERVRLEQLLAQDDELSESQMEEGSTGTTENNCFKLSAESQSALGYIDMQLQALGGDDGHGGEIELRDYIGEQQQLVVSPDGEVSTQSSQRLREIDGKLAELKRISPYHQQHQQQQQQELYLTDAHNY